MEHAAAPSSLKELAERYVWWSAPERVVADQLPRLTVSIMELGTWEDAHDYLDIVGEDAFIAILESPPPGQISDRSLAFWHCRLGRPGQPPRARRRFG